MTRHIDQDQFREAMAKVAPAENAAMRRIMFAASQRNRYTGPPMAECIERFAHACGKDGKTMVQLAEELRLPVGTLKGHARKAQQAGAVRKVQAHQGAIATFYDARGEG
jgi:DNA-binding MarR family transcriptional regulator